MSFLKAYFDTEGPLGLPMQDAQAKLLEAQLKQLPQDDKQLYEPGKLVIEKAVSELLPGERADISWISTERTDRYRDIVLANGLNDEHFRLNPVVTLNHCYYLPPVGKSLWRKKVKDDDLRGIMAKTHYPTRPNDWSETEEWPPSYAFTLVQSGLLNGKSIGFLPIKARWVEDTEREQNPRLAGVRRVIEEWLLLEYACCYLPVNPNAVVEVVSKSFRKALDLPEPTPQPPKPTPHPRPPEEVVHTPIEEVERHIQQAIDRIDFTRIAAKSIQDGLDKVRGRV